MGNIQISEELTDDIDILNGSGYCEEKDNIDKNHKIHALLDYISNENNFNFKINLKCSSNQNQNQSSIKNLSFKQNQLQQQQQQSSSNSNLNSNNTSKDDYGNYVNNSNNFNPSASQKSLVIGASANSNKNVNSVNQNQNSNANLNVNAFANANSNINANSNFINFHSLGNYENSNFYKQTSMGNSTSVSSNKSIQKNHSNNNNNQNNINNINNFEYNKNLIKTFSALKTQQEKILSGNILKVGFVGRQNNNMKLLNAFFINEKNPLKTDVYSVDWHQAKSQRDSCVNYKANCCNKHFSNSYCFFANSDNIDFCSNYFASYHKAECFSKECEFKNDMFSENYENCIELNLNDFSSLIEYVCEYDIVIYCIDKMNENIKTEAKYLDYLIKRFPIFKQMIKSNKFFVVLNKFSCEKNSLYQYQNDEANLILNKLNNKFDNKLIYELDLLKTYEEKLIYFYKILKKHDRSYLFEKNFPILNSNLNSDLNIFNNNNNNCQNKNNFNCEKNSNSINNNNSSFNRESKSALKSAEANGKAFNAKFAKFDFNQNFYMISDMFEKILTKKFILKNSNYVTASNSEKLKSKTFCEFYENFMKDNNYHSYDFNKAIEFDKVIYDSINDLLIMKFENFYQEFKYEKLLNDISNVNFLEGLKPKKKANSLNVTQHQEEIMNHEINVINESLNLQKENSKFINANDCFIVDDDDNDYYNNDNNKKNYKNPGNKNNDIVNYEENDLNNNSQLLKQFNGNNIQIIEKANSSKSFKLQNKLSLISDEVVADKAGTQTKPRSILRNNPINNNTNKYTPKLINNDYPAENQNKNEIFSINLNNQTFGGKAELENPSSTTTTTTNNNYINNNNNNINSPKNKSNYNSSKNALVNDYFTLDYSERKLQLHHNLSSNINNSSDNVELECYGRTFTKDKIEDKIFFIEKKINESFDYIKKEILSNTSAFLVKFNFLNEKIENIKKITSESKNLKGEKINASKLNFLLEIFDIYGINHYYTSMSIEMVNYYYNNLKKMFLNFIKILNHSIITINSLENNVVNIHENIRNDFENSFELKLPKINFNNYFSEKMQSQKFFHTLFFKIFIVKNLKFKPVFAYYNITNVIGFIVSLVFFIRAVRKLFKFQPNQQKIIKFLLYSISSIFLTYFVSFILNKIYNKKSEKKFNKLTQKVSCNIKFITNILNNMEKLLEEYRGKYISTSLNLLNKINEKM